LLSTFKFFSRRAILHDRYSSHLSSSFHCRAAAPFHVAISRVRPSLSSVQGACRNLPSNRDDAEGACQHPSKTCWATVSARSQIGPTGVSLRFPSPEVRSTAWGCNTWVLHPARDTFRARGFRWRHPRCAGNHHYQRQTALEGKALYFFLLIQKMHAHTLHTHTHTMHTPYHTHRPHTPHTQTRSTRRHALHAHTHTLSHAH